MFSSGNGNNAAASEDFVYSVDIIKSGSGFGLSLQHDPASNLTYLTQNPSQVSPVVAASYFGGVGGSVEVINAGGILAYDQIMEINGEPMYGIPLDSVMRTLQGVSAGTKTTIKFRRCTQFRLQQQMMSQYAGQQQYIQPAYAAQPVVVIQNNSRPTRHTYQPNSGGYYGYGAYQYDADMLNLLGNRWLTYGGVTLIISIIFMIVFSRSIWYFFVFLFFIGVINVSRGLFYKRKAAELAELDRTQPLVVTTSVPAYVSNQTVQAVYANPAYAPPQQQQQQQQQYPSGSQPYVYAYPAK